MKCKRILAFVIDLVLILLPSIIIAFLIKESQIGLIILYSFLLSFFLNKDIFYGQSIGKRICKIKVLKDYVFYAPSKLTCFIRNVFLFIWPIELLLFLLTNKRLGDYITRTGVSSTYQPEVITREIIVRNIIYTCVIGILISLILYLITANSFVGLLFTG